MRTVLVAAATVSAALLLVATSSTAQQPAAPAAAAAGGIDAEALFVARCKSCHDPAIIRAPDRNALRNRAPQDIIDALTRGVMQPMAAGLSTAEISAIAAHLTRPAAAPAAAAQPPAAGGRGGGRGGAAATPVVQPVDKMCTTNPPITLAGSNWNGPANDLVGSHYQPNPGLAVADIPKLKVKWAFSFAGGSYGQPTVVGGRIFITGGNRAYSLDAKTGCVYWRLDVPGRSRSTMEIIRAPGLSPSGWVTFISERTRNVIAVDAQSGKEIWKATGIDAQPRGVLTGAPTYYDGRLYVPISGGEETAATSNTYECCRFRGALVALDAKNGKTLWKTYVIDTEARPTRKNSAGTQMHGPAGAAIWSAPIIDVKRKAIYVATGDSYTVEPEDGSDAIVAMDLATGKILWKNQVLAGDAFIVGCDRTPKPANCPEVLGPDYDYGASPILKRLPNGKDLVLSGNKSGMVYAMDPDNKGKTVWQQKIGAGSAIGGIEWGIAADDRYVYIPVSDMITEFQGLGVGRMGLSKLEIATGREIWHTPAPKVPCSFEVPGRPVGGLVPLSCSNAQSAAIAVMPGAVFSGTMDGWIRAYSTADGKILWGHNTAGETYQTTNGVPRQPGGSIDGMGPTVAGGMLYTMSGYAGAQSIGTNPFNVLLAYSVDGK